MRHVADAPAEPELLEQRQDSGAGCLHADAGVKQLQCRIVARVRACNQLRFLADVADVDMRMSRRRRVRVKDASRRGR